MCFYNDGEGWQADVVERSIITATKDTKCDECRAVIPAGQVLHHIFMQEHEECSDCEDGECGCPMDANDEPVCLEKGCQCAKPVLGETLEWDCCEECHKFLKAIKAAEVKEGCHPNESQPALGMMIDDIRTNRFENYNGMDGVRHYFKTALRMFPELKASGYLTRIGKRICT